MIVNDTTQQSLELALIGSSARARALAQNVANVNTPGYRRVDVPFHQQLAAALETHQGRGHVAAPAFTARAESLGAVAQDGNTVDIDQEGALIAENALTSQAASQLIGQRRRMLETTMRTTG